ncbi:hypothetical protein GCM10009759_10460 [Kitasatospora saccharophila]|uniref:Uncharacterized protein n=1 Tax=Kitasatospora saccharophila TaxID=407973 RepID=A0ABN2WDM4_9ACTN
MGTAAQAAPNGWSAAAAAEAVLPDIAAELEAAVWAEADEELEPLLLLHAPRVRASAPEASRAVKVRRLRMEADMADLSSVLG